MSKGNFEQLLAELSATADESTTLAKALPAEGDKDDKEIALAAEEGEEKNPEDDEEDGEEGEGAPMAKSMTVDGEEVQIVDAEALIKSLSDLSGRVETNEGVLAKALETTLGALKSQGEMLKSMQTQIAKLGGQGTGRKTVLTIAEKPAAGEQTLAKSESNALTVVEFMAKANAAFDAKKITGLELTSIDVSLRQGSAIDPSLMAKALS